jgi:hypothetical protein
MSTLNGRSQLKMILEAEEHVVISVAEKWKFEESTTETTGDIVTPNPETESQVNPVENPTSNPTNVDTYSTTQPGPGQDRASQHRRFQECKKEILENCLKLKFSDSYRVSQKICIWCVVEKS